tara:strand:- start:322 stop:588 length:267 start_codon:yes stop_codon:yes gene_type:complete
MPDKTPLTPFEINQENIRYFVAHFQMLSTFQEAVNNWKDNLGAYDVLDWKNDPESREVLKNVLKESRALGDAMVNAANTLEKELGINA